MDSFVRFIFNEDKGEDFLKVFAGAMASTINESLNESEEGDIIFESYKTTEGHYVYEVALSQDLDDVTAEEMANTVAKAIPDDFEIEVSGGDDSSR
jgi:hypothetical protein